MPKSKNKIICKVCCRQISSSAFANHVRKNEDHKEYADSIKNETNAVYECNKQTKCHCGNFVKIPKNLFNLVLQKDNGLEVEVYKKYCSHKCSMHNSWNKGLTKEVSDSIMKMSNSKKGDKNPIHKILRCKQSKEQWIASVRKGRVEFDNTRRGKSMDEFLGIENSKIAKKNMSIAAKKRLIHGHTGKKHTEETKNKLRAITAKRISKMKNFISKPQKELFEMLKKEFHNENIQLEYFLRFYSFDMCFLDYKILIELDGDFWHCNEANGFFCKYDCQKRNLINDKRKNTFTKTIKGHLFRIWESDLKNNNKINQLFSDIQKIIDKNEK